MKQRLVYVLHDIEIGGAEVALLSAVPALRDKYDLMVVVLGKVNHELIKDFTPAEKTVFHVFDYPLYQFPLKIPSLVRYIKRFGPDIVISSLWKGSLIGAVVKKKAPGVRFYPFVHNTKFFHRLDRYCTDLAIGRADAIFVDAVSTANFVKTRLASAVDVRVISFLTRSTPESNLRLGTGREPGKGGVRFLFLGRIYKVKNLPLAIEFIHALQQRGINAVLDVYGRKGDDFARSLETVKSLCLEDRVTFKGEVNFRERFQLFKNYDFLVQLSDFEGMAMSVAEAMQNGLVPVVTPVGEIPNYAQGGTSAIFVDIADDESKEKAVDGVIEAVLETARYRQLSENAFRAFISKKCYADSLLDSLAG